MKKVLKFDQCDTLLMRKRNKVTITLFDNHFTLFADCSCERLNEVGAWIDHHYYWKGKYRKESISAVDILTTVNKTYSLEISVIGTQYNPMFTLPNIEVANEVLQFFDSWLGWD